MAQLTSSNELISEAEEGLKPMVGQTLSTLAGLFEMLFLIPLYSFLFLFYKALILNFLYEIFAEENSKEVGVVLTQTKGAIQSHILGLLLETSIVAILNSIALMILGVEYAILIGILGAILPLLIATVTKVAREPKYLQAAKWNQTNGTVLQAE